ncbi:MAG: DUF952 domain-containing protein [Rhodospirillaceae bacterium]|nr:DUF952 domain-containing protein [Rhodospirillaceae bacterium]
MANRRIFHVCRWDEWRAAEAAGFYAGSSQDRADGFIHFSTAAQLAASVAKHRAGQTGLVLLTVDADRLGDGLKWEPARRGDLFPHLYGGLPLSCVVKTDDLPVDRDGRHVIPPLAGGERDG